MLLRIPSKTFLKDRISSTETPAGSTVAIYPHNSPLQVAFWCAVTNDYVLIQLEQPLNGRREWFVEAATVKIEELGQPADEIKPRRRKHAGPDSVA